MNFIALFFLCVRMFHFIHSRRIAYLLQRFSRILDERRANPGRKQVIIIDGSATTFIIYFLLDVFLDERRANPGRKQVIISTAVPPLL